MKLTNLVFQNDMRLKALNLFFVDNDLIYNFTSILVSYTIIFLQTQISY